MWRNVVKSQMLWQDKPHFGTILARILKKFNFAVKKSLEKTWLLVKIVILNMPRWQGTGPRWNFAWTQHCCGQATCYKNLLDLGDQLTTCDYWEPLLGFFHDNKDCELVDNIPGGYKWQDFIFDYWDLKQQQKFQNHYTTSLEVNGGAEQSILWLEGQWKI